MRLSIGPRAAVLYSTLIFCGTQSVTTAVWAAPAIAAETKTAASRTSAGAKPELAAYNPKNLRRFDFRVEGKSCATCLHHMQDRMKELPGAIKVAVMLQKPYGAVVIYDSSKTTPEKILEKASEGLTGVSYEDRTDVAIKAIPIVLVPLIAVKEANKNSDEH